MFSVALNRAYDSTTLCATLKEVEHFQAPFWEAARKSVSGRRAIDGLSDILLALSGTVHHNNAPEALLTLLERWYGADSRNGRLDSSRIIFFSPLSESGFACVAGNFRLDLARDSQELLVRLTAASDRFAGTSNTVTGAENSALYIPDPDRFGVPQEGEANAYELALIDAYCPPWLKTALDGIALDGFTQLLLRPMPHPVQAVQRQQLGRTWPIVASLQAPLSDRKVGYVAIWSGAGSMTEEMEVNEVRHLFEASGAVVEVYAPETCSVEDFMRLYTDEKFDVIWVVSHGEYDHWAPKNVAIQIGRLDNYIRLDDLLGTTPTVNNRRLLVLNVCDGGRFEQLGALPRIGFAPALTCRHQAVISHLWPVRGLPAAAFGILLASELAKGNSFFDAYDAALANVRSPKEALASRIENVLGRSGELSTRLAQSAEDFENLALSGSAVFYQ